MHLAFQSPEFLHEGVFIPEGMAVAGREYPYFFSLVNSKQLLAILRKPGCFFLEAGPRCVLDAQLEHMAHDAPHFGVNLSTASAYDSILSETLSIAIEERFFLSPTQRMGIMTCLNEAISNAVFHGNLNLGSITDPRQFQHYYDTADARIQQEPYKNRRVTITAWYENERLKLNVRDEGNGFPASDFPQFDPLSKHVSGRGLFFIQSLAEDVWIGPDNRTLCMTFKQ